MNLKIEYLPIDEIKTYENNAKIHTAEQIDQIRKSIEEFGMNDPIAVWKDNVIIEGHGRLIACKELGIDKVPVIRLDHLTDKQRKAYIIAHNKITLNTQFDTDVLGEELKLILDDFDMTDFGFGEFELSVLTEDFMPEPYNDDEISGYDGNDERFTANKRVIITYKENEEEKVRELLNINEEDMIRVTYRIGELI